MDLGAHKHAAEHTITRHTSAMLATALTKPSIRSMRTLYVLAAEVASPAAVDVDWINDEPLCSTGAARCMPWTALEAPSIPERASARFDDNVLGVGSSMESFEAEALRRMVSVDGRRCQPNSRLRWPGYPTLRPRREQNGRFGPPWKRHKVN
jgi:hypothetical protein